MRASRRDILALAGTALLGPRALAGDYPERPVRIVVPFAPGGGTDLVMRALAEAVAADWKASVIIDNKPGAGTTLGAVTVAASPADGYAIFANTASFLISPHIMAKRPYDAPADFTPVARVASSPHILAVAKAVPVRTISEFTAWAKAQPRPPTFASFGTGSSSHLGFEILRYRLGLDMVHVPYRGAAPAMLDLLGGRVDAMLADLSTVAEHVKAGTVTALAVASDRRTETLPDTPTVAEAGLAGFHSESWFGLVAKAGTPPDIVARWSRAVTAAITRPDVQAKLAAVGIAPAVMDAAAFGAFMSAEDEAYQVAIRRSGARME